MKDDPRKPVTVQRCPPWTQADQERLEAGEKRRAVEALRRSDKRGVLGWIQIREIRRLRRQDPAKWSYRALAAKFSVSLGLIHKVITGKSVAVRAPKEAENQ